MTVHPLHRSIRPQHHEAQIDWRFTDTRTVRRVRKLGAWVWFLVAVVGIELTVVVLIAAALLRK